MSEGSPTNSDPATAQSAREIRPYDFRQPYQGKLSRRSPLEPLHTAFASRLALVLCDHLRVNVTATLTHVEQLSYDEFLYSIGPATCLGVLRVDPPGAQALLDLSLPLVSPMIDRMLGGSSQSNAQSSRHSLTDIEKGLALQIVERAASALAETWSGAARIDVHEESLECDPVSVRIMPGEEMVTALRFDVRIAAGGAGGTMSLCLSEPIIAELDPSTPPTATAAVSGETDAQRQNLHKNILESAVELRALLAETRIRLSDVLDMQPGDLITTDKSSQEDVQMQVQGKDKLQGRAAQLHGNRVVKISGPSRLPEDDENSPATPAAAPADRPRGETS